MDEEFPAVEDQPYPEWSLEDTQRMRRAAYADPNTGSDRHFAESLRLAAQGDATGAQAAQDRGLARAQEIKASLPYQYGDPE